MNHFLFNVNISVRLPMQVKRRLVEEGVVLPHKLPPHRLGTGPAPSPVSLLPHGHAAHPAARATRARGVARVGGGARVGRDHHGGGGGVDHLRGCDVDRCGLGHDHAAFSSKEGRQHQQEEEEKERKRKRRRGEGGGAGVGGGLVRKL